MFFEILNERRHFVEVIDIDDVFLSKLYLESGKKYYYMYIMDIFRNILEYSDRIHNRYVMQSLTPQLTITAILNSETKNVSYFILHDGIETKVYNFGNDDISEIKTAVLQRNEEIFKVGYEDNKWLSYYNTDECDIIMDDNKYEIKNNDFVFIEKCKLKNVYVDG